MYIANIVLHLIIIIFSYEVFNYMTNNKESVSLSVKYLPQFVSFC